MNYIKRFEEITIDDIPLVGGKNASLGQMIINLSQQGVTIPTGFAITADAYWYFLRHNHLLESVRSLLDRITDYQDLRKVQTVGRDIRAQIEQGLIPEDLKQEIVTSYEMLCTYYQQEKCDVAVRSSATAEDLPDASFAGQQETFLNISGHDALLEAYKRSLASLFTDRAIVYRYEKGFDHFKVGLSTGVQKMVRADLAVSGVMFTLDTDTGFSDVVMIESGYGLGELVVKGEIMPDEYLVHKPTLKAGYASIIKKQLGDKQMKMIYANDEGRALGSSTKKVEVSLHDKAKFCLQEEDILDLARMALAIEDHYTARKGSWCPMDIEWAKDGLDGKLYIVQARPETVHSLKKKKSFVMRYRLEMERESLHDRLLVTGSSIGQAIASGRARVILSVEDIHQVREGDIIVTHMTDPDWVPALKKSAGIITDSGGRTCHAAIVSRELGIPALVGALSATQSIKNDQEITLDCSMGGVGYVYDGALPFVQETIRIDENKKKMIPADILLNSANPEQAFVAAQLPNDGVGLARIEFIISNLIKVHPMACVHPERIKDSAVRKEVDAFKGPYETLSQFFINTLAQGIGMIAAAFYPKPVIVRTSDFKSNEYRGLIAGTYFEPTEENPMLGLRGASRYYSEWYQEAFALECAAFKKVREQMGFKNVKIMLPFVRTVKEAQVVLEYMDDQGLTRGEYGLELIMMCEIPSNVLLIDEFSTLFDGFSIGSNDLTQLTLGVDRDSGLLTELFDERDAAVKKMLEYAVTGARRNGKYIGICGQAPSDYPEIARFLLDLGINSLSLNPDSVVPFIDGY